MLLSVFAVVGGVAYFAMLLPLTGAEGNVHDVEPGTLCHPSAWLRGRKRRAHCTNFGPLQPNPEHMKWTAYADLFSRLALVIIATETTYTPSRNMFFSMTVCAATALVFAIKPPYQDATMSAAVITTKVIQTLAFGCGMLAMHVDDVSSLTAPLLFYALSFIACGSLIMYSACCAPRSKSEDDATPTIAGLLWDREASTDAEQRQLLQ
ncbi:unnamed protein product [Prorocentrum cordatum]|uniref:Solute carrier family 40 protein n=1 Tax=Prorocentrum cordatum TaxID=2364126 RepID=A0ABN9SDW7_9DINO|nr:unnamed protein product [Polarella glacialis]